MSLGGARDVDQASEVGEEKVEAGRSNQSSEMLHHIKKRRGKTRQELVCVDLQVSDKARPHKSCAEASFSFRDSNRSILAIT